tara:strand:- start:1435 stop:1839 length:405 start_codon:yes stop_codon:yes gene_type:complete
MIGLRDYGIFFDDEVEEKVELPKDAKFILNAGWMASPASNWETAYFISKNDEYYVLWSQTFDENLWDSVTEELSKCKIISNNKLIDAIEKMIVEQWRRECSNGLDFGPDYITEFDIIDDETIKSMIVEVWGSDE